MGKCKETVERRVIGEKDFEAEEDKKRNEKKRDREDEKCYDDDKADSKNHNVVFSGVFWRKLPSH